MKTKKKKIPFLTGIEPGPPALKDEGNNHYTQYT